jgi:uncharacterized membrane protein YgdD (TMEM256/DUF423 family)
VSAQPDHPQRDRRPSDWLVVAGAILFAGGLAATALTVARALGMSWVPAAAAWATLLAPVGLALTLVGVLAAARAARLAERRT